MDLFASPLIDEDENAKSSQSREIRIKNAFAHSQKTYPNEQIFTEPMWFEPPQIPPPSKLHIRNIDYTMNAMYLSGRLEPCLELAMGQMDAERGKGRIKELLDIALRCALKLNRVALATELVDKAVDKWSSSPELASLASEAYLSAGRLHDALSAVLFALNTRGGTPPYVSLLSRILSSMITTATATGQEELRRTLVVMIEFVQGTPQEFSLFVPFDELKIGNTLVQSSPQAGIPDQQAAEEWARVLSLKDVDRDHLVNVFCKEKRVDDSSLRSVMTL